MQLQDSCHGPDACACLTPSNHDDRVACVKAFPPWFGHGGCIHNPYRLGIQHSHFFAMYLASAIRGSGLVQPLSEKRNHSFESMILGFAPIQAQGRW